VQVSNMIDAFKAATFGLIALLAFWTVAAPVEATPDGDPERGAAVILQLGCGACHVIPGITGAKGLVGPPLDRMGKRVYIAGVLRNTPESMVTFLRDPQSVVPNGAMPKMDLDESQAQDIAAYLYTLD
jgi:mono/diheme cytochrome c family protein